MDSVQVTGVWLQKATAHNGNRLRVLVEFDGAWHEAISETADDGPISHIVEPGGLRAAKVVQS